MTAVYLFILNRSVTTQYQILRKKKGKPRLAFFDAISDGHLLHNWQSQANNYVNLFILSVKIIGGQQ